MAWLKTRARVVEAAAGTQEFMTAAPDAVGLVIRTYTRVTPALLVQLPQLMVIGRAGVGLENVDLVACEARGVRVVYTPSANTLAVADFVIGLMLQLLRPYAAFRDTPYLPAEFKKIRDTQRGRGLDELTLGILGMGRVGRRLGGIAARGFGMRVLYHDVQDVAAQLDFAATAVSAEELFANSDVVSMHTDMRPGNRHFVGTRLLGLMKASAILINTSRGEVLDAVVLAERLKAGNMAGAAIDVFDPEPPGADFPLLGLPDVILTPHMAARTASAIENMSWVVRDVVAVIDGRAPAFPA